MIRYDIRTGVKKIKTKTFLAISTFGLIIGGGAMSLAVFGSAHAAGPQVVYDSLASVSPQTNYPSQPFQAQQTNEFGDYVHLAGTARLLNTVNLTMSNWALQSTPANQTWCASNPGNCDATGFNLPITVNIYASTLTNDVPNNKLGTKTVTVHVPWRPEGDPSCGDTSNGKGWKVGGTCFNYSGLAFNATFDLSSLNLTLPNDVIVGFVYNTQSYGPNPTGVDGPYNSLNIAVPDNDPVTVGTDDSADATFWNTNTASYYSNPNCQGGTFCLDTHWAPNGTVAMQITATPNTATVTIVKNLNGSPATAVSANSTTFPMESTWSASNIGSGTGTYGLGPTGFNNPNPYQATTADMTLGASYTTHEVTGSTVATSCTPGGAPYVLKGYTTGDSLSAAEAATPTSTVPNFTNIQQNKYVVVWNSTCPVPTTPPTTKADCKDNGWKTYNNPSFKNKDKCIDYVVAHGHKVKGDVNYTAYGLKREAEFDMNTYDNNKGAFDYSDANHDWYHVKVSSVKVSGHDAWFAGVVTNSKNHHYDGNWLFAKVTDGNPDVLWGSFTNQAAAEAGVNSMTNPGDGPFNVTKGNLKVN